MCSGASHGDWALSRWPWPRAHSISAVSFELFQESYSGGGALRAGLGFAAGATVFVVVDALLDRVTAANPTGFALLAGVTLDGVPENVALGGISQRRRQPGTARGGVRQQLPRSAGGGGEHA